MYKLARSVHAVYLLYRYTYEHGPSAAAAGRRGYISKQQAKHKTHDRRSKHKTPKYSYRIVRH